MKPLLTVIYNDNPELEYDRNKPLPDHQALYLQKMDEKMDQGITVGDQFIEKPDTNQKAQFVAANLAHALQSNHEESMASLCSYIAVSLPNLLQLKITQQNDGMEIDFNFDEPYKPAVLVAPPTRLN